MREEFKRRCLRFMRALCLCLMLAVALSCASDTIETSAGHQEKRLVKLIQVPDVSPVRTRAFPAIAKASREVNLAFRVSGPLVSLPVNVGDYVEKSGLIAQIDPRDYEVRLNAARAALETYRAEKAIAQLEYNRHRNLLKTEAVAKARYDRVKAHLDMITAKADAAAQELQAAQDALNDTRLEAPFSGFVDTKFVENHDNVQAMQPIVTFLDCSEIEVAAGLPEEMLARGVALTRFECGFDAYPGLRFSAELKELGTKPLISNQTYPLTVVLSREDSTHIRPGMAATVFVTFSRDRDPSVYVPVEAVVSDIDGRSYLWIYTPESGRVNRRYVETGSISSAGIEVKNNLAHGEWVVRSGAHFLKEDEAVTPVYAEKQMF